MMLRTDRSGFALPMVIMVVGFLTAGVLAAFARSGSEIQLVDNQRAQTAAFAVAEAGLQQFLATGMVFGDSTIASDEYAWGSDTARITANRVRPSPADDEPSVWLIRSVGTVGPADGRPQGSRTVAQLALRTRGTMQVLSAWTSLSGLRKNGADGDMTGQDACTADEVAGVAVPTGGFTGKDDAISGSPPIDEMGTQAEMAAQIDIDWAGITNPAAPALGSDFMYCVTGSYGYDSTMAPCTGWPSSTVFTNDWPTVIINGSSGIPSHGRGTLIVTGDLTFGGGDVWDGIVLVGGKITDNGNGAISGAVVSGLNVLKGMTVGESSRANGTKSYQYDSCAVANAADAQGRLVGISNAWVDSWSW